MRFISSSWLNPLPDLHLNPINVVVFDGPRPNLVACFALRCFQRLSLTYIATQRRPWQDYWYTRGMLTPVLSSRISSITRSADYIFILRSFMQRRSRHIIVVIETTI